MSPVFPGNAWIMPEYASYEHFTMVDGPTCHQFTKEEYDMYIAITVVHLRKLLRKYNGLKLSQFVQPYMEFIATVLGKNKKTEENADILARGVGWYFHSIEAYSGTPKGLMAASDLFVEEDTVRPLLDDIDYDIAEILNEQSATELLDLVNNAQNIDIELIIRNYLNTPHAAADATLQGCYLGPHCTLKCGMSKLVELFQKDVEAISNDSFHVDLDTRVTGIEYNSLFLGEKFNKKENQSQNEQTIILNIHNNNTVDIESQIKNLSLVQSSTKSAQINNDLVAAEPSNLTNKNSLAPTPNHSTIVNDDGTIVVDPNLYNAVITAHNSKSGQGLKYYARYGVVCTASVHSIMKTIQFPEDSLGDQAKSMLWDSSCSVYYKKVLFCFPEQWWDNKQFTRLFALTQDAINFKKQRCKHCHSSVRVIQDEEYTSLDVSQGAYPCIMAMAQEELMLTTTSCSDCSSSDDDFEEETLIPLPLFSQDSGLDQLDESDSNSPPSSPIEGNVPSLKNVCLSSPTRTPTKMPKLNRDSTMMYLERASSMNFTPISFCGVNMIWESHMFNKQTPVLSASIVGNLAEHCVGLDDNLVRMIVFKQLEKIYRSTVAVKRCEGDFAFASCIPKPLWSRVTHWAENPNILQSYSLITDCSLSTDQRITLAQDQHLYFAGEALHVEHGGSVHGAIFSADYAVDKILEKYCGVHFEASHDSLHLGGLLGSTSSTHHDNFEPMAAAIAE
jgi:hypothetical protein